jgi:hypothetical protein
LTGVTADHPEIAQEIEDIKESLRKEQEIGTATWADCFKMGQNRILLRTFSGMALQAWQQLTGVNFIFYYGTTFFTASGIKNPFLITIATNVVNVGMTVPGILAVDRVGRRKLLLIGAAGMCVCEYLVAILGVTLSSGNQSGQKALVAFVCIYIVRYTCCTLYYISTDISARLSSLPLGVLLPGLSSVKSSLLTSVPRVLLFLPPVTGSLIGLSATRHLTL